MAKKCACKGSCGASCRCDTSFIPPIDCVDMMKAFAKPGDPVFAVAWERENGFVSRYDLPMPADAEKDPLIARLCERIVKFLLWSSGGWKLSLSGPSKICRDIKAQYAPKGERKFDYDFMTNTYGKPMTVEIVPFKKMPKAKEPSLVINNHTDGCRIGFDLGASDFKISALKNGKVVFSEEFPWDPRAQNDPEYHYSKLNEGLKEAAKSLPRVDVIGGSTAGVVVDNCIRTASLFTGIKDKAKYAKAQQMFQRLQDEWGVPVEVANDGDVTALSGAITMKKQGVLGIAMGSSEAVGFINTKGAMTGRISELAFAPIDLNGNAGMCTWSLDVGVGAMGFSQQAVNHLALQYGMKFPKAMKLPERLKVVQAAAEKGDPLAVRVFAQIGIYLAYSIPWYREFYDFTNMMILGRVTSGIGGTIILENAKLVLKQVFPAIAEEVDIFMPDEKARRLGQSVAAAQIPEIPKAKKTAKRK